MSTHALRIGDSVILTPGGLDALIGRLAVDHRVIGPRVADGAVVLRDLASAADLPTGWIDDQEAGHYRLRRDDTAGPFDHVVGPHSLKNFLFPPREPIARFGRVDGEWRELPVGSPERPLAVIGMRGCDLAALAIQDRVFLRGRTEPDGHVDESYERRRHGLFLVAVDCRRAAPTCFCHSTGSGPAACSAAAGRTADLTLTDLGSGPPDAVAPALGERRHACRIGSERGAAVIAAVAAEGAVACCSAEESNAAGRVPADLERAMWQRGEAGEGATGGRCLDTGNIRDLLFSNLDHPRWEDVGARCLSCTNCTLVCPTCFCASVTEVADLSGDQVTRERQWESCFSLDHARMHGTSVRHTTASRYRQWLTHKLAGWIDQFGTSGCTGCGRCITWCPVGIDLTAEVAAIRDAPSITTGATP